MMHTLYMILFYGAIFTDLVFIIKLVDIETPLNIITYVTDMIIKGRK